MKIVADASIPFVAECFSHLGEVKAVRSREITPDVIAKADILVVRTVTGVNADLLGESSVRFVATATSGLDHIDADFLQSRNIGFASAPGSNANSVAEYVVAALLEIGKRKNIELHGKSIGVIGVGNIGSRVAEKAAALGMKVYLNDPPLQRQTQEVKYLPIENLFDCDFITLHTPLTFDGIDKTFYLADEKFLKSLKAGCVFLNTSRGGVVETGALKDAIKSGKLAAAVLDVWEGEPNIDTELLEMVDIATPHTAGYSLDGKTEGMIMVYKAACEYFGFKVRFDAKSFLPEPAAGEFKINPSGGSEQKVLLDAVEKIHKISEDDAKLREILARPTEQRAEFFEGLRADYPVHGEFRNSSVAVKDRNSSLAKKLKGIGFQISQE